MAALRHRTADAHAVIDAAFSHYDLADPGDYRAFLHAHARALPAVERLIAAAPALPPSRPRAGLLSDDLAALGETMPAPLPFAATGAAAWGALYVIEGSRHGGGILAGRVAPGLPTAYLSARHQSGEWRTLGHALDAEAARQDTAWLDEAVAGAEACFALYGRSCA